MVEDHKLMRSTVFDVIQLRKKNVLLFAHIDYNWSVG